MGIEARTARDVMTQPVISAHQGMPVCKVTQRMAVARTGCVLIVDDPGNLVGVFTERDLVRMFTTRLHPPLDEPVAEHMSRYPLTLDPGVSLDAARRFMKENKVRHVPLVEQGRLVGVVTSRDIPPATR